MELANTFLTVMGACVILMSTLSWIWADALVPFFLPKTVDAKTLETTIGLTRIMLVYPILLTLSNTFGSILNGYHRFGSYALSSILYNLGIIIGVACFAQSLGIYATSIGVVFGFFLHMLIRFIELKATTYRLHFSWKPNLKGLHKILWLMLPRTLTLMVLLFVLREFSIVGQSITGGGYAAATFARNFQSFSISVFGVAIATASLPTLSILIAKKDVHGYAERLAETLRTMLFFTLPATVGTYLLATPLIQTFLGGGAFNQNDVVMTSILLTLFVVSIPFESIMHLYSRAFYANQQVIVPTIASILFGIGTIGGIQLLQEI